MSETLPETMTCIEITEPGGPEVLKPGIRPLPTLRAGEVLIRVAAAGINRAETMQRQDNYPVPDGATDILGLEAAGTVAALADGVGEWNVGDPVCALTNGGAYAEYCATPAAHCLPVPDGLNMVEAGSLPECAFTVWTNVFDRAGLKPGETLLVHGGSSGIGVSAIQMARALGSRVMATARTAEKCAACEALGADRAVNYAQEDFVATVKALTDGKGVDVILDMVAGSYVNRNIEALAPDGRLVHIATMESPTAEVDIRQVMVKRLVVTGSTLRPQSDDSKTEMARALRKRVWPLIDQGRIKPVVHATFPLAEAAAAHRLMESSAHIGKIVLTV